MAYRDDRAAMLARVDALERELDEAEARRSSVEVERDALAAEAALLRAALVRAVASRGRCALPRVPVPRRRRAPWPVLTGLVAMVTTGFVLTGLAAQDGAGANLRSFRRVTALAPAQPALPNPAPPVPALLAELAPARSTPLLTPAWPLTPTDLHRQRACSAGLWSDELVSSGASPLPEAPDVRAAVARIGARWSLHADLSLPVLYPGQLEIGLSASCLLADGQIVEERTGILMRPGSDARTDIEFFAGESLTAPLACIVRGGVRFDRTTLEDREIILADTRVE
jgi:hypothetical protein